MNGRRGFGVLLIAIGVLPACIAVMVLWVTVRDWYAEWRHPAASGGTIGGTITFTTTTSIIVSRDGGRAVSVEPWHLILGGTILATLCFAGGWVLWSSNERGSTPPDAG